MLNKFQELNNQNAVDKINSCNLIRSILESNYLLYNYFNLKNLISLPEVVIKKLNFNLIFKTSSIFKRYLISNWKLQ